MLRKDDATVTAFSLVGDTHMLFHILQGGKVSVKQGLKILTH
jgi:hypothetical protein